MNRDTVLAWTFFAFGFIVGVIVALGVIEVEIPECSRISEMVDWRRMKTSIDAAEGALERLDARIAPW